MKRDNLIAVRKERGLSQAALGKAVGVSLGYIGMLEAGTRNPSLNLAFKIAQELRVEPGYIFDHLIPYFQMTKERDTNQ